MFFHYVFFCYNYSCKRGIKMDRAQIQNISENLREQLGLEIPIDFNQIFSLLSDLDFVTNNEGMVDDGKIIKTDNGYSLNLKGNGESLRDRFTIAHELGHLFLGHVDKYEVLYRRGANELEYEANEFAANLLMPEQEFRDAVNDNLDSDNFCDIEAVSEIFKVSESAVLTRGKFLGLLAW